MFHFLSDQKQETPLSFRKSGPFSMYYVYERANETKRVGDCGQDYLVLSMNERSCSFVVCDGVSLSFCGEIAAKFLGDRLFQWLEKEHFFDKQNIHHLLNEWTSDATALVNQCTLDPSLPLLLTEVLEEKRKKGSETMFVCGQLMEVGNEKQLGITWCGDIRIRFWHGDREVFPVTRSLKTSERWSTQKGIDLGDVHASVIPLSKWKITRLCVYTDGLANLDASYIYPAIQELEDHLERSRQSASSDDFSYVEIFWEGS